MLAEASSTTTLGSQPFWAMSTATIWTRYVAVSVAKSARLPRSTSWAGELLDLAAHLGQLGLHLEDVRDLDRLRGDRLERGFAGPEVPDARLEIDDLAGHLDRVRLLRDDLGGQAVERAQRGQRVLPAVDRDPVRDLGDGLVAVVEGVRRPDVAAQAADRVTGHADGPRHVLDLELDRAGSDDPGVIDRPRRHCHHGRQPCPRPGPLQEQRWQRRWRPLRRTSCRRRRRCRRSRGSSSCRSHKPRHRTPAT